VRQAELGLLDVVLQHAAGAHAEDRPERGVDLGTVQIVADEFAEERIRVARRVGRFDDAPDALIPEPPLGGFASSAMISRSIAAGGIARGVPPSMDIPEKLFI
jgi:hypothetical protein